MDELAQLLGEFREFKGKSEAYSKVNSEKLDKVIENQVVITESVSRHKHDIKWLTWGFRGIYTATILGIISYLFNRFIPMPLQ